MTATRVTVLLSSLVLAASLTGCASAQTASTTPTTPTTQAPPANGEPVSPTPAAEPLAVADAGPAAGERACGSRGLAPCNANEYCDFPDGSQCGATDRGGVCRVRPEICTREYRPVCGCDGATHATRCVAASHGVDTASEGPCAGGATP